MADGRKRILSQFKSHCSIVLARAAQIRASLERGTLEQKNYEVAADLIRCLVKDNLELQSLSWDLVEESSNLMLENQDLNKRISRCQKRLVKLNIEVARQSAKVHELENNAKSQERSRSTEMNGISHKCCNNNGLDFDSVDEKMNTKISDAKKIITSINDSPEIEKSIADQPVVPLNSVIQLDEMHRYAIEALSKKPFRCHICYYLTFSRYSNLKRHYHRIHKCDLKLLSRKV